MWLIFFQSHELIDTQDFLASFNSEVEAPTGAAVPPVQAPSSGSLTESPGQALGCTRQFSAVEAIASVWHPLQKAGDTEVWWYPALLILSFDLQDCDCSG